MPVHVYVFSTCAERIGSTSSEVIKVARLSGTFVVGCAQDCAGACRTLTLMKITWENPEVVALPECHVSEVISHVGLQKQDKPRHDQFARGDLVFVILNCPRK